MPVGDPEIMEVPREVGAQLGAVIGRDPLDRHGRVLPHLRNEGNRPPDRVMVVDRQHRRRVASSSSLNREGPPERSVWSCRIRRIVRGETLNW